MNKEFVMDLAKSIGLGLGGGIVAALIVGGLAGLVFQGVIVTAYPEDQRPKVKKALLILAIISLSLILLTILLGSGVSTIRRVMFHPTLIFALINMVVFGFAIAPQVAEIQQNLRKELPTYVPSVMKQFFVRFVAGVSAFGGLTAVVTFFIELLRDQKMTGAHVAVLFSTAVGIARLASSIPNSYSDVATMRLYEDINNPQYVEAYRKIDESFRQLINRPVLDWAVPIVAALVITVFQQPFKAVLESWFAGAFFVLNN